MKMRVLGLVPARGGSKGVPRKNIKALGGRSLLAYTADAALAAKTLSRVVLSTDDDEIAAVGAAAGLDVPFLRPSAMARDDTPSIDVVRHAVDCLESMGEHYDAVCLLQPTNPFRRPGLIDECVDVLENEDVDSVVTVALIPAEHHPLWAYQRDSGGTVHLLGGGAEPMTRRQDLPPAYFREGSVYVTRVTSIDAGSLYGERCYGFILDEPSVNIDGPEDWARAEALVAGRR